MSARRWRISSYCTQASSGTTNAAIPVRASWFQTPSIERGRKGPGGVMPRWGDSLSPEQIWELVAYLKHLGAQPAASQ